MDTFVRGGCNPDRVAGTTAEIVYDEAVRAIVAQEAALDGLRGRIGTLLAAASLVTAFLGEPLARTDLGGESWVALGGFLVVASLSLVILWPWTWYFTVDARVLVQDHLEVPERSRPGDLHVFLARTIEQNWQTNQPLLEKLFWCFRIATLGLALEVLAWVLVVTTS
jgi:hypothetical protein